MFLKTPGGMILKNDIPGHGQFARHTRENPLTLRYEGETRLPG